MKHLLKADLKKFFTAKLTIFLLILCVALPLLNNGVVALMRYIFGGSEELGAILGGAFMYVNSFSPINNVGLVVLIVIIVVGASDFTQNTIRNKIVAGYKKEEVYISSLLFNLITMTIIMFVYTTATYLFFGLFNGFTIEDFGDVLKIAVIAFSALWFLYTLVTLFLYKFKTIIAPLVISLGGVFLLMALYALLNIIPPTKFDVTIIKQIIPFLRIIDVSYAFDLENVTIIRVDTALWWVSLLVNLGHITWLTALGVFVSKRTDYK